MTFKSLLTVLAFLSFVSSTIANGAKELSVDNFESSIKGKNAFVKFWAPWCGHCKALKPAWDQLGDEYAASSSVLIGGADCTDAGEELCEKFEVRGYPTLKYFLDGDKVGQDYQGGRDFASLKSFVEETLEVKCEVSKPTECSEKEQGYIEKMKAKSSADRVKQIQRLEGMAGDSMKAELKAWLRQRLHILRSLEA
eukprot:Nitzschia sp. Nitz4//scaffold3_size479765//10106//10781//NITZ4_000007-RA/size479765-augustus-gene-0.19-mRNA-1//-1//CDS//3329550479//3158//frame0